MGEPKTYAGSCHCGKVRYQAEIDLEATVISCNCSICSRSGTLLQFIPESQFKLLSGSDDLTEYRFKQGHINHHFCRACGIKSFARGVGPKGPMVAINARCLEGVDLEKLNIQRFDGKSL
jgi:hypothetical protein